MGARWQFLGVVTARVAEVRSLLMPSLAREVRLRVLEYRARTRMRERARTQAASAFEYTAVPVPFKVLDLATCSTGTSS